MKSVRPVFWWTLIGTLVLVTVFVIGVQFFGGSMGSPCIDSFSCRGFLIAGAECLDEPRGRYCSRYCDLEADCPVGWRCLGATPTALTIETDFIDKVCVRGERL